MLTRLLILFSLIAHFSFSHSIVKAAKPNVIVIYSDDQGSIDTFLYGSKDLHTPNLDKLAKSGIRFTQMYSPSAICSASRAGLLTGKFPIRAGVPGNVPSEKGRVGMPTTEVTMAEMFKQGGYKTGHVGKWHLGYTPETMPLGQGFDSSYGHMGGCIDNYSHFFYWRGPNRHDLWRDGNEIWEDGKYFPDLMVRECCQFLETNKTSPFFLYWAINMPHYPLQGTEKWRQRYEAENVPSPRKEYNAFVSSMDDCIGTVIDKVETLGLRKNTIILFQSDHGHSTEERTFFGGGNAGIYRGAKACLFEGGIRVPSIISYPGVIPKNEVRDQMATGCDWYPTLAELCGLPPIKKSINGKSIIPILKSDSAKTPHDEFFWMLGTQWVVRKGDWKLLGNPVDKTQKAKLTKDDKLFLANINTDPTEMKNLAKENPEVVKELLQIYESKYKSFKSEFQQSKKKQKK